MRKPWISCYGEKYQSLGGDDNWVFLMGMVGVGTLFGGLLIVVMVGRVSSVVVGA
jgi:hypothetical protein